MGQRKLRAVSEVRDTTLLTGALSVRVCLQAASFVLTARLLGVDQFGLLVAVLAISSFFASFSALGFDYVVLRDLSRSSCSGSNVITNAITAVTTAGSFFVFSGLLLLLFVVKLDIGLVECSLVLISELLGLRYMEVFSRAFQAKEWFKHLSFVRVFVPAMRLLGLGALALSSFEFNLYSWAVVQFLAVMLCVLGYAIYVYFRMCSYSLSLLSVREGLRDSHMFIWGAAAHRLGNDADKLIVAKFDSYSASGVYGAGYRIVEMFLLPANAYLGVKSAEVYSGFRNNLLEGKAIYWDISKKLAIVGVAISISIYLCSPLVVIVLGSEYQAIIKVLQLICVLPLLSSLRAAGSLALQAARRHGMNSTVLVIASCFNVLGALLFVPTYGWQAAAIFTMLAESFSLVLITVLVMKVEVKQK